MSGELVVSFRQLIIFGLGLIVVLLFALERFNSPIAGSQTLGPFAQVAPRLFATDSRYRRGLRVYLACMIGIYVLAVYLGPNLLGLLGVPESSQWQDSQFQAIFIAVTLIGVSSASDDKFPGNLENYVRRLAHRSALIPNAIRDLARQLEAYEPHKWSRWLREREPGQDTQASSTHDGKHAKRVSNPWLSELEENVGFALRERVDDAKLKFWIRGNIMLSCIEYLARTQGGAAVNEDANAAALSLIRERRAKLRPSVLAVAREASPGQGSAAEGGESADQRQLFNDLEKFQSDTAVLLASILAQVSDDRQILMENLKKIGFEDIPYFERSSSDEYALFVLVALAAAAGLSGIALYLFRSPVIDVAAWFSIKTLTVGSYSSLVLLPALSAFVIYAAIFCIGLNWRNAALEERNWSERLGYYVKFACGVGLLATAISAFLPLILSSASTSVDIIQLAAIYNLPLAILAAYMFAVQSRYAARSRFEDRLMRSIFNGPLVVHVVSATILCIALTFWIQHLGLTSIPQSTFSSFDNTADNVLQSLPSLPPPPPPAAPAADAKAPILASGENDIFTVMRQLRFQLREYLGSDPDLVDVKKLQDAMDAIAKSCAAFTKHLQAISSGPPASPPSDAHEPPCHALVRYISTGLMLPAPSIQKDVNLLAFRMDALRAQLGEMLEFRQSGETFGRTVVQMIIGGIITLVMAATFSGFIRYGRTLQLNGFMEKDGRNTLESFKRDLVSSFPLQFKTEDAVAKWIAENGLELPGPIDQWMREMGFRMESIEQWLILPDPKLELPPIEGLWWPKFKTRLEEECKVLESSLLDKIDRLKAGCAARLAGPAARAA